MSRTYRLTKRIFDFCLALFGLVLTSPFLLGIGLWIRFDSKGPVLFKQRRVGQGGEPFWIYKFRTMVVDAERLGKQITVGHDPRIARCGRFLRKSKLDELPQLLNILKGEMSFVGPRPEVPFYVDFYNETQKQILTLRPGLTDYASIKYRNENELLMGAEDADQVYIHQIMPDKLRINLEYLQLANWKTDLKIILETVFKVAFFKGGEPQGRLRPNGKQRMLILGLLDACIITVALLTAYLLRFDFEIPSDVLSSVPVVLLTHIVILFASFSWCKLNRSAFQYASTGELAAILKATAGGETVCFLLLLAGQRVVPDLEVPRSIYLLSFVLVVLGAGGLRFAWRVLRDSLLRTKQDPFRKRTLIIGAGGAGVLVAKNLLFSSRSHLQPVAFVDDDPAKQNLQVLGLPVLGGRHQIPSLVEKLGIQEMIIALPSAPKEMISQIIQICKNTKAALKILPSVTDVISGNLSVNMIRDVSVEDLLGREAVQVDLAHIASYLQDQVVLVTGAGGSIGRELCRQIARFGPKKMLLLGHGENSIYEIDLEVRHTFPHIQFLPVIADIQDRNRIEEIYRTHRPAVVFHAAAHKHVPLMELQPSEAIKNNIFGTKNVAECAHQFGASHFVMISSDKAVNPTSVMGATKRVTEMIIQGLARRSSTKFVAVRFGNVLGSRGSVVPIFKKQIQSGGPVTVTHPEMIRFFMTIPEATQLVIQAGALAKGGEIFILDMGQPVKIADLARDLIKLSGLTPGKDIEIRYTGIRPGEKLYEEILTHEEGITATKHNRIFVGKPTEFSWEQLQEWISELEQVVMYRNPQEKEQQSRNLLWKIVPTFQGAKTDRSLLTTS